MWIHIKGEKRRCIELCIGSFRTPQEAAVARAGDGARAGNGGVAVDGGRGVGRGDRPSAAEGSVDGEALARGACSVLPNLRVVM